MKETLLTPRQWAFVVITGGAVCALPFMQSGGQRERPGQEATLDGSTTLPVAALHASPSDALLLQTNGSTVNPVDILPSGSQGLPQWASDSRSPFDELVGQKAAPPAIAPPSDTLPLQPLRPWISGPGDAPVDATTPNVMARANIQTPDNSSSASASERKPFGSASKFASVESSPWHDDSAGLNQTVGPAENRAPMIAAERGLFGITSSVASISGEAWPDQKISEEQLSKIIRAPQRELASATIPPPQAGASGSSIVPAPQVANPPVLSRQTITRPVAAQVRFGESIPDSTRSQPQATRAQQNAYGSFPANDSGAQSPPTMAPLPVLPDSRKQHVIFQPPRRK